MHMADALLSPTVGGVMWLTAGAATAFSCKKLRGQLNDSKVPLMGVLGAFVFAAQMINFTIPGTGSSGHLGGGLLLAILLGPYASFLVLSSVLIVQALFFADGGILALGSNMFNMGVIPCFIAYPLVYKVILGHTQGFGQLSPSRLRVATICAAVVGLQFGAFAVVLETVTSGISELPLFEFSLLMLPIHLGIGIVEGFITVVVLQFIGKVQPEVMDASLASGDTRKLSWGLLASAVVLGVLVSWFASTQPDGLEWSIAKVAGTEELQAGESQVHELLSAQQKKMAILPDYHYKNSAEGGEESWPVVESDVSLSGLLGGTITLLMVFALGWMLRLRRGEVGSV